MSEVIPTLIYGNTIVPEKVRWLWPNRIPLGEISLIVGNPGVGKSHLGIYIAAQVTIGGSWPDCDDTISKGKVLILTAEDSLQHTMSVRLIAAGADLSKVLFLIGGEYEGKPINIFKLPQFSTLVRDILRAEPDIHLIVIDPISAYMGQKNENRNIEVREFLAPLAELANKYNLSLVGISHLNKDMTKLAIFRTIGSIGFTAAARAVWMVVEDNELEGRCLLLPVKMNLCERADGLAFHLHHEQVQTKDGPTISSVCQFEERAIKRTADEVFADHLIPVQTKQEEARKWLQKHLIDKPCPAQELIDDAKRDHIAERTLRRAKEDLGVKHYAITIGGNKLLWMWKLGEKK